MRICRTAFFNQSRNIAAIQLLVVSVGFFGLAGCSTTGQILHLDEVKPWERGTLAREDMQLITDVMDQSVDDHIYFSKEGSKGGSGIQGGGCGCN
ncbi:MAG: DUF4266 domain-containing protein [Gammaproteobacteria bacterium]|nr:DUF4266 domain-containing protein [Gammaproteobacteria bacterium]